MNVPKELWQDRLLLFFLLQSILVQIRAEIMSDPRARLDPNPNREYSEYEAKDAFERMVQRYGWNK